MHIEVPLVNAPLQTDEMLDTRISENPEVSVTSHENGNSSESDTSDPSEEEFTPVVRAAVISDGKPEFTFVQRLTRPFEGEDEFYPGFGTAVIEIYETETWENPIDSIHIDRIYPTAWGDYSVVDINFDGFKDIVVVTDRRSTQEMPIYTCLTWNDILHKYEGASFPDWGFICVDAERGRLLASWRNSAVSHSWAIWEYLDGELTLTHACGRTYLNRSVDGIEMVHFHEEQLLDGEMQVVFNGDISENELDAFLLDDGLWNLSSENWVGVWEVNGATAE